MSIRPLAPALQKKAEVELHEVPNRVASDILAIREWLKKQPHLQTVKATDQWILAFLRGNKFSLERCKEKLDMFYTFRTLVPEILRNRDPCDPIIQNVLQSGIFLPLKNIKEDDSSRICISQIKEKYNHSNLLDVCKVIFMIVEIMIVEDDNFVIGGEDALIDLKDVGLHIFTQWTPSLAKKIMTFVEKGLPMRLKSCHMMHTPPGFETAYSILRLFLGEKLKQRFYIYSQLNEAVHEVFPRSILPQELGGENGTVQELIEYWKTKLESYRDWFLAEEDQHSDESLRPEAPKTTSTLFGVEGSFRKLDVD